MRHGPADVTPSAVPIAAVVVCLFGGVALVAAIGMSAVGTFTAHRRSVPSEGLNLLSWALLILAGFFGAWTLYTLSIRADVFTRAVSR